MFEIDKIVACLGIWVICPLLGKSDPNTCTHVLLVIVGYLLCSLGSSPIL